MGKYGCKINQCRPQYGEQDIIVCGDSFARIVADFIEMYPRIREAKYEAGTLLQDVCNNAKQHVPTSYTGRLILIGGVNNLINSDLGISDNLNEQALLSMVNAVKSVQAHLPQAQISLVEPIPLLRELSWCTDTENPHANVNYRIALNAKHLAHAYSTIFVEKCTGLRPIRMYQLFLDAAGRVDKTFNHPPIDTTLFATDGLHPNAVGAQIYCEQLINTDNWDIKNPYF